MLKLLLLINLQFELYTENLQKSDVFYWGNCMNCGNSYSGKTKGMLGEKKKKHFKSLTNNIYSGISNHTLKHNHNIDWDNFKIINTASSNLTLTIFPQ